MVTDPVCKMSLAPEDAAATAEYADRTFFFCSESCHAKFAARPAAYAGGGPAETAASEAAAALCPAPEVATPPGVDRRLLARTVPWGVFAAAALLGLYFGLVTLVSGWSFALNQFGRYWPFIIALALGFGVQVGLYTYLRRVVYRLHGSGKVVAVSGTTSGAAMVSCCAHYLVNLLPALGATGVVALVAQYQVEFFLVGLAFNLAGMFYVGRKVIEASRHMALMAGHGHEAH